MAQLRKQMYPKRALWMTVPNSFYTLYLRYDAHRANRVSV